LVHFQLSFLIFSMSHASFNGVLHDLESQKADLVNAWVEASDNSVSLQLLWRQTSAFPWAQPSYLTIRFNPSVRCSNSFCKSEQPFYYFSISWFTVQQHFLSEFISPTRNKSVFTLPLGNDMGLESYALGNLASTVNKLLMQVHSAGRVSSFMVWLKLCPEQVVRIKH
jgi:hypothetical protein